ncbi:hypothetical protein AAMO2058_001074200 [Amorphochlora amoebiformis]
MRPKIRFKIEFGAKFSENLPLFTEISANAIKYRRKDSHVSTCLMGAVCFDPRPATPCRLNMPLNCKKFSRAVDVIQQGMAVSMRISSATRK